MSNLILAIWFGLIAADRIDLAGGHAALLLTPFIALTPVVVLSEMIRRERLGHPILMSRRAIGYAAVSGALVCVALVSAILAIDVSMSAGRTALLFAEILGTLMVCVLCADRDDLLPVLAAGATASLLGFVAFDVAEGLWWVGRGPEMIHLGAAALRFDGMQSIGPIPRLPGLVNDGNRAGFVLVIYAWVIARGQRRTWLRRLALVLAALLFVLPLSRSATLAALATAGMSVLSRRGAPSLRFLAASALTIALAATFLILEPGVVRKFSALSSSPVAERLSSSEGSSQGHMALIERGIGEGMSSLSRTAIGIGYGDAYAVLQDVFPGSKYGNFHSLYVTMYAEAGIVAFVLAIILMGAPLVFGGPWRPLVAGAWAFGLFYQPVSEPIFWFLLAIAWLTAPPGMFSAGAAVETSRRPFLRASQ
jgi:hypothetical protein